MRTFWFIAVAAVFVMTACGSPSHMRPNPSAGGVLGTATLAASNRQVEGTSLYYVFPQTPRGEQARVTLAGPPGWNDDVLYAPPAFGLGEGGTWFARGTAPLPGNYVLTTFVDDVVYTEQTLTVDPALGIPDIPERVSVVGAPSYLVFTFEPVVGAQLYEVQIVEPEGFFALADELTTDTTAVLAALELDPAATYTVRLVAHELDYRTVTIPERQYNLSIRFLTLRFERGQAVLEPYNAE